MGAAWIVTGIMEIGMRKPEMRIAWGDLSLTPLDGFPHDVNPLVRPGRLNEIQERISHASRSAPNIQNPFIRLKSRQVSEVLREFSPNLIERSLSYVDKPTRRIVHPPRKETPTKMPDIKEPFFQRLQHTWKVVLLILVAKALQQKG